MKTYIFLILFLYVYTSGNSQAYLKLVPHSESSTGACDAAIDVTVKGVSTAPYMITWWDNSWQPSTGLHATDLCSGKIITTTVIDMNCRKLESVVFIDPDPTKQVSVDTVILVLPSAPGASDGSLTFHMGNVQPGSTRAFSSSGSGGMTLDSVFTGLQEDNYSYAIYGASGLAYQVGVSLYYSSSLLPCEPFVDSFEITTPTTTTSCDGELFMHPAGASGLYYRYIYMPSGGGSTQINSGVEYNNLQTSLCPGPYLIDTYSDLNNYWMRSTIYVDDPLIADSTWGTPPGGSTPLDTIILSSLTACGIDYDLPVDTAYVSGMTCVLDDYYEVEISVIQGLDTTLAYATSTIDTSHNLCFDITLFCADSSIMRSGGNFSSRNLIYIEKGDIATAGIQELHAVNNLTVFPNPFSNIVSVKTEFEMQKIMVYGMDGKLIQQFNVKNNRIELDLHTLQSSVYFINVLGVNKEMGTMRLVKM